MKFAKQLESEAEDIPSEWRPYLIQYKALKKLIAKVAVEIERRGLSASFLRECLGNNSANNDNGPKIRYYFTGESPNVHPCIEFIYDPNQSHVEELLEKIISKEENESDNNTCNASRPKLRYKRTENDTDFFTLSKKDERILTSDTMQRRQSAAAELFRELMDMTLSSKEETDRISDITTDGEVEISNKVETGKEKKDMRSLVIELEHDDEFFATLMTELQQAAVLQDMTSQRFKQDVNELERRMAKLTAPNHVTDMYAWRAIFSLYMDAQIFKGRVESDRSIHSAHKSKAQMEWFTQQLGELNLLRKFKSKASRESFEQFIALNTELITMKHYQLLNQTAVTKILKKHDKRSGLNASTSFPNFIQQSRFFNTKLADILCASILGKLTTIIPQPDDYLCPVCMSVAWRPIRLACGHVFCVRCLIKAQKKKMDSCPLCRHPTAVKHASSLNLDVPMQNFLKLYFPREIKQKKKDNEREQAMEDIQAMTGRAYTEEQLMRMGAHNRECHIM
ncbi:hypothetical protein O0I10_012193 [Lichtheimia ornata]|uniref:SPX domain-containing protein n=1 Tax=Lichtheimia ornata TaxID=688661 RepID=A0AAD7URH0_9FUNG|nr:uncharacterized protein O0I10_012193 [Lichtheimia ornata]KAJ8652182.1 hypothetical protein O0I10_012193 [Lichtheimia ornata]